MSKEWFTRWFNEDYQRIYAHRDETEAQAIIKCFEDFAVRLDGKICMDLCCGLGRLSSLLANKAEYVMGIDLSEYFIEENRNQFEFPNLEFRKLDMRHLDYSNDFDVIFHIFTSFGYFDNLEENISVFDRIYQSLKPGGYYYFDFLNVEYLRQHMQECDRYMEDDLEIIVERRIEANFVIKDIKLINQYGQMNEYMERVMLIDKKTFDQVFQNKLFQICHVFGDYHGHDFNPQRSERLIYILKKL